MAQAAEKVLEFPSGGIADFYMEDDEIAVLEREEAKEQFGNNGIAKFSDVASRMASYGRGGDDTLAHVATGEIVIPLPLIDNNPEMKASIFKHLEELGVEDPEQYVVGSSANSINPETGLREFGWLSKTIRKVTRGVKKAVKSVVKVIKKAAPVVIPFVLNTVFPGLGPIYSGALGAGIGTLVQGGSLKDAFKSALIGGAIGGATAGVQGALPGGKGAMASIKDAAKLSNLTTAGKQLTTGQFGQAGLDSVRAAAYPDYGMAPMPDINTASGQAAEATAGTTSAKEYRDLFGIKTTPVAQTGTEVVASPQVNAPATFSNVPETPGFFESIQDAYTPGGRGPLESLGDAFFPSGPSPQDILTANNMPATAENITAATKLAEASAPSFMRTVLPSGAAALGTTIALGGFDTPDDPEAPNQQTGADLIEQNPDEYLLAQQTPRGSTGPVEVASRYGYDPSAYLRYLPVYGGPVQAPPNPFQRVAEGGEIFPRRVGGIMPNEGTPGKDSVRAMLMPGEFVMTTDAVKGLGNGNNDQGIRNMYDMMRGLEAKGRAMA